MRIIAGEARGRRLLAPKDATIRPLLDQIRESIFSSLGDFFVDEPVLDLFSGIGSFGLEALSRGARKAVFVDLRDSSLSILRRNIENLSFGPRSEVVQGDALKVPVLKDLHGGSFRVVFLDPPFKMFDRSEDAERVFERAREILQSTAVAPDGVVLLRHPTNYRADCPIPVEARRVHGESVVLRFRPPPAGS